MVMQKTPYIFRAVALCAACVHMFHPGNSCGNCPAASRTVTANYRYHGITRANHNDRTTKA
ncbi:hypothetical protein GHA01_11530 [Novacetimonas hansenii]|uniref:Uncharacterized protein n=1 Tax=Novacetimonas hansenii TaxID=436 RepID=A0ABQ0SDK4_NOVHA|nr:hypothetical protein Gaha_0016_010 [Novacetimonas hansenii JCM 7643]GBQ52899.1 hypothetical protein AA0243_0178 [Novacetimonas hansenii NRIC 0243]GEC63304.1 hypothetical protein GHA01_11530 [Novacetimonas hansenii]